MFVLVIGLERPKVCNECVSVLFQLWPFSTQGKKTDAEPGNKPSKNAACSWGNSYVTV